MRGRREHQLTVSLAGNPNVGKGTLFNALTGLRQHTGNWPGKTVEVARGCAVRGDTTYLFTDLPGTYSLQGVSQEEQIAAEHIRHGEADCTVVVCDGSCLERSLILALQILQCTDRVVVCVNLMDEARRRGIGIDRAALQEALGAPVVMTAAAGGPAACEPPVRRSAAVADAVFDRVADGLGRQLSGTAAGSTV